MDLSRYCDQEDRERVFPLQEGCASGTVPKEAAMDVLIADDDPGFRGTLKRLLEAKPNVHTVWEAKDGEEAVQLTRAFRPDVVLMDLALPRIDGFEATRMIKAKQPEVRVIVCSVRSEEHTSELQSRLHLVCRLLLEKKKQHEHRQSCR